ncbi:C45 family autoproteolytic acyltransferase/hydolase [Peterkaempfera bronchialis]|uniref:Peptidase C45 n=1 Tax=Peterkaempfera bronchialis TaxID=2126346 RepID=A0A345T3N1_9ACTN|nr:C45 family peptidase [Peterkaempfera bronchialis]AXI80586.1 peptidase C45 [Peterkaempfera bronchialis]
MKRTFTSSVAAPRARGREFGLAHAAEIGRTIASYRALFARTAGHDLDLDGPGAEALAAIRGWAPDLAEEIEGIAEGAGLPVEQVAAINARTEILATLTPAAKGECSAVVLLADDGSAPVAVQTWDWYSGMAPNWLVWTIPHGDGRVTRTVTEYGVVGKIGANGAGIGVLFTILHHERDGRGIGVPVHVVARRVLDDAADINDALTMIASAAVSASTSLTVVASSDDGSAAITAELHPGGPAWVRPDADGVLIHTNHFLTQPAALGDTEPRAFPDTLVRYDIIQRGLRRRTAGPAAAKPATEQVLAVMANHLGGGGAVCCHPDPRASDRDAEYATLATVVLDTATGGVTAIPGGPCTR